MIETLKKTLAILTSAEKKRALILLFLMFFVACFETISVVSIMPFMAVLSNPSVIETNKWLNLAYQFLGFENHQNFLFFLGLLVFILLAFNGILNCLYLWASNRYVCMRGYFISKRLLKTYLEKPYMFFINRNSGDIAKNILEEANKVVQGSLIPFMSILSKSIINVFIISALVIFEPVLAITLSFIIGFIYFFIYKAIKTKLLYMSKDRINANKYLYIVINEAFGGIKDLKLMGLENVFLNIFNNPARKKAVYDSFYQTTTAIPKYILEALAIGSGLIATLYLISVKNDIAEVLPIIAFYAYAGKKIVPAMQEIFKSVTAVKFYSAIVDTIHYELTFEKSEKIINKSDVSFNKVEKIILNDLLFKYPNSERIVINKINLTIDAKTTVGLAGATGSGKTTLVDIILGLLPPLSGTITVNNDPINKENLRAWQNKLGYVPQAIFLIDDSIAKNIAFGVPLEEIDFERVKSVAKMANLSDFIEKELPNGYETLVGERGIRLSGGQRQRIGIARALYRDPEVLILDEATSALDNITEKEVMNAIKNLSGLKTLIIIAHRLTTVQNADVIHFMKNGKIVASGKYDELVKTNKDFENMVKATE